MPFFLDFEGEDLECLGGKVVATGKDGWSVGLFRDPAMPNVATNGRAIFFDGEDNSDLGRGEVGWLGNVSDEVVFDMSMVGFTAFTICFMPLGMTGGRPHETAAAVSESSAVWRRKRQP